MALGLSAEADLLAALDTYLDLLQRWNKAYNLTAIRDREEMIVKHLLDSLVLVPHLQRFSGNALDVGTGAGLPGVPLSLVFPEREFCLLDSNGKKTRFLFQVKTELGLDNMIVRHSRVEALDESAQYPLILSRAFASLQDMVAGCRHLLAPGGRYLAMKGACPEHEIEQLPDHVTVEAVHKLDVPGLNEERHLVEIRG